MLADTDDEVVCWFKGDKAVLELLDATIVQHNLNVFGFKQRQKLPSLIHLWFRLVQSKANLMENSPFGVCIKLWLEAAASSLKWG